MIQKLLDNTHLYIAIAFIATLAAKVALELHGTPTADLTNILYGETAALIGVPIVNTAVNASATAQHQAARNIQLAQAASDHATQPPTTTRGAA